MGFPLLADLVGEVITQARPPRRLRVSEAAERYLRGKDGPWRRQVAPYIVEPMDLLAGPASRLFESVVFCGPARASKTFSLLAGWLAYILVDEPAHTMLVFPGMDSARDFTLTDLNPALRHSPELQARLGRRQEDNTFDKVLKDGTVIFIRWPTETQLSQRTLKNLVLSDYDRIKRSVGGQGTVYDQAQKRTETFLSAGMLAVESNCGFELTDPTWEPSTPHEAPPVDGILALFNRGDRRRYYWRCPVCGEYYRPPPGLEGFTWAVDQDLLGHVLPETVRDIGVVCTANGCVIGPEHKRAMLDSALWVPEGGEVIIPRGKTRGELAGRPRQAAIASFWLPGAAAAYQSWPKLVRQYLVALREWEATGSEESLRKSYFADLNCPYLPKALERRSDRRALAQRKEPALGERQVPAGVRFLVAAIDVQAHRFVVQVLGFGVGLECWLIDRFDLLWSRRRLREEPAPVDPAGLIEDWELLVERVIEASYPLADGSGRHLRVLLAGCDSGGQAKDDDPEASVTRRAYDFWRALRERPGDLEQRFVLLKGLRKTPDSTRPPIQLSYPDNAQRSDRKANARGEIPVFLLDTTALKDALDNDLKRPVPGPGFIHFPDWLDERFFAELEAETRTARGWEKIRRNVRNEAIDLFVYARALAPIQAVVEARFLPRRARPLDWRAPPAWALPWDRNPLVFDPNAANRGPNPAPPTPPAGQGAVPPPPVLLAEGF